jgi:hypothetical protein
MRLKTKIEIFLAAVVLTFFMFNVIIPPHTIELLKIGKLAGYKIIANILP